MFTLHSPAPVLHGYFPTWNVRCGGVGCALWPVSLEVWDPCDKVDTITKHTQ